MHAGVVFSVNRIDLLERCVANALLPLAITPLMKALHAFPRALYRGQNVPADFAVLFSPVRSFQFARFGNVLTLLVITGNTSRGDDLG